MFTYMCGIHNQMYFISEVVFCIMSFSISIFSVLWKIFLKSFTFDRFAFGNNLTFLLKWKLSNFKIWLGFMYCENWQKLLPLQTFKNEGCIFEITDKIDIKIEMLESSYFRKYIILIVDQCEWGFFSLECMATYIHVKCGF